MENCSSRPTSTTHKSALNSGKFQQPNEDKKSSLTTSKHLRAFLNFNFKIALQNLIQFGFYS